MHWLPYWNVNYQILLTWTPLYTVFNCYCEPKCLERRVNWRYFPSLLFLSFCPKGFQSSFHHSNYLSFSRALRVKYNYSNFILHKQGKSHICFAYIISAMIDKWHMKLWYMRDYENSNGKEVPCSTDLPISVEDKWKQKNPWEQGVMGLSCTLSL